MNLVQLIIVNPLLNPKKLYQIISLCSCLIFGKLVEFFNRLKVLSSQRTFKDLLAAWEGDWTIENNQWVSVGALLIMDEMISCEVGLLLDLVASLFRNGTIVWFTLSLANMPVFSKHAPRFFLHLYLASDGIIRVLNSQVFHISVMILVLDWTMILELRSCRLTYSST